MNQIDLIKLIKRISDRWYILAAMMVAGGLFGLLISRMAAPIYESLAVFSVTIDYSQTGALTDIQEDQAMRGVGSVILSDQVIINTLTQINSEGDQEMSQSDFFENSFLDREEFRWTLRYRNSDPQKAESVVNAWAKNANTIIQEGLIHSQASSAQLEILNGLKACLQEMSIDDRQSFCGSHDLGSLISSISEISRQIHNEKTSSLGLFSSLSVSLVNEGKVPRSAVLGQRNLLVISGAMIGFFLSIFVLLIGIVKRSPSI